MKTSDSIDKISLAMALAQPEMGVALKSSINPFFKSNYSGLPAIWKAIKGPLSNHKLFVLQELVGSDTGISVTTRISHESGQWMELGPFYMPATKKDAQGFGSAASYARRYALASAFSIVSQDEEDDDGNESCKKESEQTQVKKIRDSDLISLTDWIGKDESWGKNILTHFRIKSLCDLTNDQFLKLKDSHEKRNK